MQTCPSQQQLEQLLTESLGDAARQTIGEHVETCEHCQRVLEQCTELTDTAHESPTRTNPSGDPPVQALIDRLRQRPPDWAFDDRATADRQTMPGAPPRLLEFPGPPTDDAPLPA